MVFTEVCSFAEWSRFGATFDPLFFTSMTRRQAKDFQVVILEDQTAN